MAPRLKDDKAFVSAILIEDGVLEFVSDRLKDDKDFLLQHPTMLEFASERLKDDKEVVSSSGKLVYFASERLRMLRLLKILCPFCKTF